jgi:hypothetical protein
LDPRAIPTAENDEVKGDMIMESLDEPIDHLNDIISLLMQLSGSTSFILLILLCLKRPLRVKEIAEISDYSVHTVRKALERLRLLEMVAYFEEDMVWAPTEKAETLRYVLGNESIEDGDEKRNPANQCQAVKKFSPIPCSRRSEISSIRHEQKKLQRPPPQPPPIKQQKLKKPADSLPNEPEIQQAYALLLETGIPEHTALEAIQAAVTADWESGKIINVVKGWLAYAASEQGQTIQQPGFLAAKRLRGLRDPPQISDKNDEKVKNPYTSGIYGHLIRH